VAIALDLARARTPLQRDVIVALTAGEETGGEGVRWLLAHRRESIDAELALNEGGGIGLDAGGARAINVNVSPAEKTYQSYRLVARGKGGHSSIPPTSGDPVLALARALVRVGEHRFPARVLPAARESLAFQARFEQPPLADAMRRAAASAPSVAPADERILGADRIVNAAIRTTCVATMLQAAPEDNVLPTSAEAVVNCRILPDETREATQAALARAIADPAIELTPVSDYGSGPASTVDGAFAQALRRAVAKSVGDVPVVPFILKGASDSRFLRAAGIAAYGVGCAPIARDDPQKGFGPHGPNERLPLKWLATGVGYLRELVLALAE